MINIRTLDCGVRVITDRTDYLQSAAIGIWVKAGSVDEEDKYAGVSHFIEHMMFKGTKNRTAKQIADDMDKLGSQFNFLSKNNIKHTCCRCIVYRYMHDSNFASKHPLYMVVFCCCISNKFSL